RFMGYIQVGLLVSASSPHAAAARHGRGGCGAGRAGVCRPERWCEVEMETAAPRLQAGAGGP
ncbi:MAG: hypothetical protein ABIL09_16680, partial [Gemmatimonadota bacterium]